MADNKVKFNTQTGYQLNLNNTTSKIRLDFDTNVINPENSVLGTTEDCKEFVLINPNLIGQTDSNGFRSLDVSTSNGVQTGSVKHYVFEKLVNPNVVGCENCGNKRKYTPDGVNSTTGLIENLNVLPVINKEVVAEFEISPEAYHSLEIDLVGHRRICDDSGNCFYEEIPQNSTFGNVATSQTKSWIYPFFNWIGDPNSSDNTNLSRANSSIWFWR
jgi:hypothetical protein